RHFVAHALPLVGLEFLRKIRQHLWRHAIAERARVASAIGQLNLTEQALEGVIVLLLDGQRRTSSPAGTKAIVHARRRTATRCRCARDGGLRLAVAEIA